MAQVAEEIVVIGEDVEEDEKKQKRQTGTDHFNATAS